MLGYRRFLALLLVPLLMGCAVATPSHIDPAPMDSVSPDSAAQTDSASSDCHDADLIREIRAEWAANNLRAIETYGGGRFCLRATILGVNPYGGIMAQFGDATFLVSHRRDPDQMDGWQEWVITLNSGDPIVADCQIRPLGNPRYQPLPQFTDCGLAEDR